MVDLDTAIELDERIEAPFAWAWTLMRGHDIYRRALSFTKDDPFVVDVEVNPALTSIPVPLYTYPAEARAQIEAKDAAWRRITDEDMPGEELCILGGWTDRKGWVSMIGFLTEMPFATHWLPITALPAAPARETE